MDPSVVLPSGLRREPAYRAALPSYGQDLQPNRSGGDVKERIAARSVGIVMDWECGQLIAAQPAGRFVSCSTDVVRPL